MSRITDTALVDAAYGALELFKDTLKAQAPQVLMSEVLEYDVIGEALRWHGEHLTAHQITQNRLDAFKLIAWMGGILLNRLAHKDQKEKLYCSAVIDGIISAQDKILCNETSGGLQMKAADRVLLKSLLWEEKKGNFQHGIWANGLYVAYHCAIGCVQEHPSPFEFGKITVNGNTYLTQTSPKVG